MRHRLVFAALLVGPALAAAAACGLDENGLLGPDASLESGTDVVIIDVSVDVPQGCQTLDVSACADAAAPSGWSYAAVVLADAECPSVAYEKTPLLFGPQVAPGGCACGCTVDGGYSCAGTLMAGSKNPNCNGAGTPAPFDAGDDGNCFDPGWNDPHISITSLPTPSGSPTCNASETGDGGWTASAATTCTPACDASDFCALAAPYHRCVVSTTSTTCPAPFTAGQALLGTAANVSVVCNACGCQVPAPTSGCDASVYAFTGDQCSGGEAGPIPTNGTCVDTGGGHNINSFFYTPLPPPATCTPSDAGGSASLQGGVLTVCCLPP